MKIICILSNIDTFPEVLIYPEVALLLIILVMATSTSAPEFWPVQSNATVSKGGTIILSSSDYFLSEDTVYILHKTVELGYFFIILFTLAARFLSDKPNTMQIMYSIVGTFMCISIGILRMSMKTKLADQGPHLDQEDEEAQNVFEREEDMAKENLLLQQIWVLFFSFV